MLFSNEEIPVVNQKFISYSLEKYGRTLRKVKIRFKKERKSAGGGNFFLNEISQKLFVLPEILEKGFFGCQFSISFWLDIEPILVQSNDLS